MWFHNLDGRLYLTGTPGGRELVREPPGPPGVHLPSQGQRAGRPAGPGQAGPGSGGAGVLARLLEGLGHAAELEAWVRESPLVEVEILEAAAERKERA